MTLSFSVVIVTDNETLLHKELEMLALRTKRVSDF